MILEYAMNFAKIFFTMAEYFLAITHLFVLLGVRNSKLGFIRRQAKYFFSDAMFHVFNLYLYTIDHVGYIIWINWIIMMVGHFRYWYNLISNPPKKTPDENLCRIFHWSCVEFVDNRFGYGCGSEVLQTVADIIAHSAGFYFMFITIPAKHKVISLLLATILIYRQTLNSKYFLTKKSMMPKFIANMFSINDTDNENKEKIENKEKTG
jgi:hypothetical protein